MWKRRQCLWLAACLVCGGVVLPARAAGPTYKFSTKHYIIETTISPEYSAEVAEMMEILYAGYSKFFTGRPRSNAMLRVVIYKTHAEYVAQGGMAQSGGQFTGDKIETHAEWGSQLRGCLAHEGFHQFFYAYLGGSAQAQWINEGLAEFFRTSLVDGTDIKYGLVTKPDYEDIRTIMASSDKISMKDLLTLSNAAWNENMSQSKEGLYQYRQSRFLVHFLRLAYEEKYVKYLNNYIKAVQNGKYGAEAVSIAFGNKFSEVADQFPKWVEKDLKPSAPECCSAHLFHLVQLLYQFEKAGVKIESMDDLLEKVKSNKDVNWSVLPITLDSDNAYGPKDLATVEKWFVCPKSGKGYEIVPDPDPPEEGLKMIVCYAHHKKLAVCASMEKEKVSGGKTVLVPSVRNTQTKMLKKAPKEGKKKE